MTNFCHRGRWAVARGGTRRHLPAIAFLFLFGHVGWEGAGHLGPALKHRNAHKFCLRQTRTSCILKWLDPFIIPMGGGCILVAIHGICFWVC